MNPRDLVEDALEVITFPPAGARVLELLDDPEASQRQLADALAMDPPLASRALRIANSPMFMGRSPVDDLNRAVTVLGTGLLRNLVLSSGAMNAFQSVDIPAVSIEEYWRHSILCGALADAIARQSKSRTADAAFTAGLVHDLGQLLLFLRCPEQMRDALSLVAEHDDRWTMREAEREVIGYDHCEAGNLLAEHWGFPESLRAAMQFHHSPLEATAHQSLVAAVHIANSCAVMMETESEDLDDGPPIEAAAWEMAGVSPDCLPEVLEAAQCRFDEMREAML